LNDQEFSTNLIEAFENKLALTLNPVQPDPEFAGRLRKRVFLEPTVLIEKHRSFAKAFLIFAFGLFGGVLLVWLLRKRE
jgi:hypothetical protein